ncbi:type IV secretion system protein [Pectobacterium carotovorum]|uniref:type IV secretion system protein n=1 Tax=Pectobacterium carotovorum TaxID=554 RepID=UPI0015DFD60A|nr:type IV secretion system protein [Pectobacterium carotovorum]MBA0179157.1 type IV secretion system protein [Pectobacterium carotovorum]
MDVQVVQPIFEAIDNGLNGTLATGTSKMMAVVSIIIGGFWGVYIGLRSLSWYISGLTSAIEDIFWQVFKCMFITFFAFGIQPYVSIVVPFVSSAPSELTALLTGEQSGSNNQIDVLVNSFINTVIQVFKAVDWGIWGDEIKASIAGGICLIVLILSGIAFLGVCISTLIVLKVSTTLFLAIGPLFIALALFEQTRQYFYGWISVVGGFMLANLMFGMVISVEINYITKNIIGDDGFFKIQWMSILSIPLIFGAFTAIAQALPDYAAQVMGGGSVGNSGGMRGIMGVRAGINAGKGIWKGIGLVRNLRKNRIK